MRMDLGPLSQTRARAQQEIPNFAPDRQYEDLELDPSDAELEWEPPSFGRELLMDFRDILGPSAWKRANVQDLGKVGLALFVAQALDNRTEGWVQDWRTDSSDTTSKWIGQLGDQYSFGVIAAFYAVGKFGNNPRERSVARDSLMASIIAAGIITPSLKASVGRNRPFQSDSPYEFNAFGGGHSFPSGHTTQAFAIASTIAEHYDSKWVKVSAYGVASLVGLSRIEQNAHFPSDVVAGALIGTYVGRKVSRLNEGRRSDWEWQPYVGVEGVGLSIRKHQPHR